MIRAGGLLVLAAGLVLVTTGCGNGEPRVPEAAEAPRGEKAVANASSGDFGPIKFEAQELPFRYDRGVSGLALPVEPTGGGVAMLDYDNDGDLDLFFAQGCPLPIAGEKSGEKGSDVLLRNEGGRRFTESSAEVGLTFKGYGMGATVADYDADGDADVYVTRYGVNTLWRNEGEGRFVDATAEAGVGCDIWSVGAAFADYDDDGDLDLYVANYFSFDAAEAPFLSDPSTGEAMFGAPVDFPGLADVLYRNDGSGRFKDVSAAAGIAGKNGRGMGVLAADLDGDERVDFFVANDAEPNFLWRNQGDGTFEEVATSMGLAVNGAGMAEANMGVARGDTDGDGLQDLLVTHFYDEHDTLWRAGRLDAGALYYRDATFEAGLAAGSRPITGWGTALADFDQDGWLDLIVTTGHIRPEPQQRYRYESPPLLWRGGFSGRFTAAGAQAGPYFQEKWMGRGLAVGDLDGDFDIDTVIVHHDQPAVVLWNETERVGNVVVIELSGRAANRDAIGARVSLWARGTRHERSLDGGGSYLSSSERRIFVGVGQAEEAEAVEVRWPSGLVERFEHLAVNRLHRLVEPEKSQRVPVADAAASR